MPAPNSPADSCYAFGSFRLDPQQARLFRGSEPVPLTPKVFDTLALLVENAGRVLSRETLMERLWPDTVVSDTSLTQNIFILRKTLGEDEQTKYIETVSRRGYMFVAPVTRIAAESPAAAVEPLEPSAAPAPVGQTRAVGTIAEAIGDGYSEEFVVIRRRRSRRQLQLRWFLAVLVVCIAITAAVVRWLGSRHTAPAQKEEVSAERLPIDDRLREIAISPDGKYIAYVSVDSRGSSILLRQRGSAQAPSVVDRDALEIFRISFSPGSDVLYYQKLAAQPATATARAHYSYHAYSLGSAQRRVMLPDVLTAAAATRAASVAYVPDSDSGSLMMRDRDGKVRRILQLKPGDELGRIVWSPDEKLIGASHFKSEWYFSIIDPAAGTIRDVAGPWPFITGFAWMPDSKSLILSVGRSRDEGTLSTIDITTGAIRPLAMPLHSSSTVSVAADGKTIATIERASSSRVVTFSIDKPGERREMLASVNAGSSPHWCAGGFVAERNIGGTPDLWLMNERGAPVRQLTATPERETEIAVAPDRKRIAYTVLGADGSSALWMVSLESGVAIDLLQKPPAWYPSFTPDGSSIVFATSKNETTSMVVDIESRELRELLPGMTAMARVSPDGRQIVAAQWIHIPQTPEYIVVRQSDRKILTRFDYPDGEQFAWIDSDTLSFVRTTGADYTLFKVPAHGGTPEPIASFDSAIESYDYDPVSRRFIVATTVESSRPYLIHLP